MNFEALSPGQAVIAATSDGTAGSMELLVMPAVDSILVSPEAATIAAGDTLRLVPGTTSGSCWSSSWPWS